MALRRAVFVGLASIAALPLVTAADTLVFRNGSHVRGALIQIRNGVIEFDEQRGVGRTRTLRIDRNEVVRIEFDAFGRDDVRNDLRDERGDSRWDDRVDDRSRAGMRERAVTVPARDGWINTGITVRAGQTIFVTASGQVRWGEGRRDGPAGESNSPENDDRPIPTRPAGALIGRVGTSSDPRSGAFFIGDDQGALRMRDAGPLFLAVNDDYLQDNSGAFRVTVYY